MTPRDCFGVAVRVIGLLVTIVALLYLVSAAGVAINPHYRPNVAPATHYLTPGVIGLLFGLYLLHGAPLLLRLAYPDAKSPPRA